MVTDIQTPYAELVTLKADYETKKAAADTAEAAYKAKEQEVLSIVNSAE